jgi:hypothetical protein
MTDLAVRLTRTKGVRPAKSRTRHGNTWKSFPIDKDVAGEKHAMKSKLWVQNHQVARDKSLGEAFKAKADSLHPALLRYIGLFFVAFYVLVFAPSEKHHKKVIFLNYQRTLI